MLDHAGPGSLILMHDGGGDRRQSVAALLTVIEGLLERDLRFVAADALLAGARARSAVAHLGE